MDLHWYAARIIGGHAYLEKVLERHVSEKFATPVIPNLIFIRCTAEVLQCDGFRKDVYGKLMFYCEPGTREPSSIDDRQMRIFIAVNSVKDSDLLRIEVSDPEFFKGQKVRVIGGLYKGIEGIIKRIKGDRRLLVQISGICAVATSYIHPALLEPVE